MLRNVDAQNLLALDDARLKQALTEQRLQSALWQHVTQSAQQGLAESQAGRMADVFAASSGPRAHAAWLYWLAGDGARATRLAADAALRGESPHLALRLAAELRASLDDDRARRVFLDATQMARQEDEQEAPSGAA